MSTVDTPVAIKKNTVIRASAGTGKTFQLSNRFIDLLNGGANPDQILATTFTRKAAGEILERILCRLAEATLNEKACDELAHFIDDSSLSRERCGQLLLRLTNDMHRVRVCTLDSFFSQIASSFGFELQLPPDWSILDRVDDEILRAEAIDAVLQTESEDQTVALLNRLTKGMANRSVSDLISRAVSDLYSVFLDTHKDAWQHFPDIPMLKDHDLDDLISQIPDALPEAKAFDSPRGKDVESATERDWDTFMGRGIAPKILDGTNIYRSKDIGDAARHVYGQILDHVGAYHLKVLSLQTRATFELLARFDLRYSQLKDAARGLLFDDVTSHLVRLASDESMDRLAFRMDGMISHILLDEFQDTSLNQWRVIRPFARLVTSGKRQGRTFFCVGDMKQAIYGWRGGIAELFDSIEAELTGIQRQSLSRSYRSSPVIIDTVNAVFDRVHTHNGIDERTVESIREWQHRFEPHTTHLKDLPGYACLETAPRKKEHQKQAAVTISYAAERVAELVGKAPNRTVGVLLRRNACVGMMILELRRLGIAASEEGGNPVDDSAAVQLILSLLALADHPGDTIARFHVANSPFGQFLNFTEYDNHLEAGKLARRVRLRLQNEGYGPVILEWAQFLARSCEQRGKRRLQQLVEQAWTWQARATTRTQDFANYVRKTEISDPTNNPVRVMTIHQAKGLEFDIVFLADLDSNPRTPTFVINRPEPTDEIDKVSLYRNDKVQKLLPDSIRDIFDFTAAQSVSESMCVLYVALTRAAHALHMVIAPASEREKSLPKTQAGYLRTSLQPATVPASEPTTILYESGDPQWYEKHAAKDSELCPEQPNEEALSVQLKAMPDGRRRGLRRTAPSKKEGSRFVKLAGTLAHKQAFAMERGTVVHAWFELIDWFDNHVIPSDLILRSKAEELDASHMDIGRMIADFHRMLQQPRIAQGLTHAEYSDPQSLGFSPEVSARITNPQAKLTFRVDNERRFAVRLGGELISGTIDRLVLIYDHGELIAADIIDFKTDTIDPQDSQSVQKKLAFYKGQLETYRPAAARLFSLPESSITTRLFFVGAGLVANV